MNRKKITVLETLTKLEHKLSCLKSLPYMQSNNLGFYENRKCSPWSLIFSSPALNEDVIKTTESQDYLA